jgi:hypothetical protein
MTIDYRSHRVADANIDIDYIASVSYRYRLEKKVQLPRVPGLLQTVETILGHLGQNVENSAYSILMTLF